MNHSYQIMSMVLVVAIYACIRLSSRQVQPIIERNKLLLRRHRLVKRCLEGLSCIVRDILLPSFLTTAGKCTSLVFSQNLISQKSMSKIHLFKGLSVSLYIYRWHLISYRVLHYTSLVFICHHSP